MATAEKSPYASLYARHVSLPVRMSAAFSARQQKPVIALAGGLPAPEVFPIANLVAAAQTALEQHGAGALQYTGGPGVQSLPAYIARRAYRSGIDCEPGEVLITSGASQAIDLAARTFLNPGDQVWAESPTFFGAIRLLRIQGAEIRGFPVDEDGLDVDAVAEALAEARRSGTPLPKLFYVIPNFQNPTGAVMSLERRSRLAALSREYGFLILEDDAYGELCYDGDLPAPIKALAPERVLYCGTFSKIIAPGLRMGWVIAPVEVIGNLRRVKSEGQSSVLMQELVAQFVQRVDLDTHIAGIREIYQERRATMLAALAEHMPPGATWAKPAGGFFVWLRLPKGMDSQALLEAAMEHGVSYVEGSAFHLDGGGAETMRLCFTTVDSAQIADGIARVGAAIKSRLTAVS